MLQLRNVDVSFSQSQQTQSSGLTRLQYGNQLQGWCYSRFVSPLHSLDTEWQTDGDGLQAQTAEPRQEHILRTESPTSLLKSMIPSGAVDQDLLQTLKQSQTSFTISWGCTTSRMADDQPPKPRRPCSKSCAMRIRID